MIVLQLSYVAVFLVYLFILATIARSFLIFLLSYVYTAPIFPTSVLHVLA